MPLGKKARNLMKREECPRKKYKRNITVREEQKGP
jgi:hypothetical protein